MPLPQHWKQIFWSKSTLFSVEWKVIAGQDLPIWGNALRKIPSTLQHQSTEEQRPQQMVACFYSLCNATNHHIFPWASPQWIWNVFGSAGKRTFFPQDRAKWTHINKRQFVTWLTTMDVSNILLSVRGKLRRVNETNGLNAQQSSLSGQKQICWMKAFNPCSAPFHNRVPSILCTFSIICRGNVIRIFHVFSTLQRSC